MNSLKIYALTLVFSGFAMANYVQLDRAATRLEGSADHFHHTAHREMPGSHIDSDAAEIAQLASWFHGEIHHQHPMSTYRNQFRRVKSAINHASHTVWHGATPHVRADFRQVQNDAYSVDHALYWGGHIGPHPHF